MRVESPTHRTQEEPDMSHIVLHLTIAASVLALSAIDAVALAQPRDKGGDVAQRMQKEGGGKDQKGGGQHKAKHHNGKSLLGDKLKKNGKHEFHKNGKFTSSADVQGGKIAGVSVKHADKGDVPVKKYKTNEKMAELRGGGQQQPALIIQAQYVGTTYIGFAYIDDYGYEVIYWFPYDMVLDPYTGAIDYYPA
jgi:hypothetical protein